MAPKAESPKNAMESKPADKRAPPKAGAAKPGVAKPSSQPSPPAKVPARTGPAGKGGPAAQGKTMAKTVAQQRGGKAAAAKKTAPAAPKRSPEEEKAATTIQAAVRGRQTRQKLQAQRRQQAEMEAEMETLRQAAWMAEVEYERKQEAKARKKAQEEAARRKQEAQLRKGLLEAAFDNEVEELQQLLEKGEALMKDAVDAADTHGNTLLSEAAAGGAEGAASLLLGLGANPNSRGEFQRSPLWRAAFLGHAALVRPLLEAGADPRIGDEGGQLPAHVASTADIKAALAEWDVAATDSLVAQWQQRREEKLAQHAQAQQQAVNAAQSELEQAEADAAAAQKALKHAHCELEKRISEHDTCVVEQKPDELVKVTLQQIQAAEVTLAEAKRAAAAAAEKLDMARLRRRELDSDGSGGEESALVGVPTELKDLDDILVKDVGGKLAADARWPLIIDTSGQASVFLRYMDSNYCNALSPAHVEPTRLRRSILGAFRYGKPFVLDVQDVDLWPEMANIFDAASPGLLDSLLTKSILQNDAYLRLARPEDGEEYEANNFQETRVARFKFVVHTTMRNPNTDMVNAMQPLRIKVKR